MVDLGVLWRVGHVGVLLDDEVLDFLVEVVLLQQIDPCHLPFLVEEHVGPGIELFVETEHGHHAFLQFTQWLDQKLVLQELKVSLDVYQLLF